MTLIGDTTMWEQTGPKQLVRDVLKRWPALAGAPVHMRSG